MAAMIGFPVFKKVEHLGILGGPVGIRREKPSIGKGEIVCGDGNAVGPLGLWVEMENPFGEVIGRIPFESGSGKRIAILCGIFDAEAFKKGADDIGFQHARNEMGIEALRFVAVTNDEDIFLVRDLDIRSSLTRGKSKACED